MNNIPCLCPSFFDSVTTVAICILVLLSTTSYASRGNETDGETLLEIKAKVTQDPLGVLSSWSHSLHFCMWYGVTCGHKHQKVTALNLTSMKLGGSISPHMGNLSFLRVLDLSNNSFHGEIPGEVGRLQRLQMLYLNNNSLNGEVPFNISHCSNLIAIGLDNSNLIGEIREGICSLHKLESLGVSQNNLTGRISPCLGNLSSLEILILGKNNLVGRIPDSFGQLGNLRYLLLDENQLSGALPPSIFNLSSIRLLYLRVNKLHGSLPPDLFNSLPNVEEFNVYSNQLNGSIPCSLSNASNLASLKLGINNLTGSVPDLEKLNRLGWFSISDNFLGSGGCDDLKYLCSMANATKLDVLLIQHNNFGGALPECIGNLSSILRYLSFGYNQISGSIPYGIGNLIKLLDIGGQNNNLSGVIPETLGYLKNLSIMELDGNNLSGKIPESLGNLSKLFHLNLADNNLQGIIPSFLGECKNLQTLNLSLNHLTGTLPTKVFSSLIMCIFLDFSQNHISGPIPREVGNLQSLESFGLSRNMLSGEIPGELGSCTSLEYFYLDGNFIYGLIPSSLRSLRGVVEMDLSYNNLSGQVPEFFASFVYLVCLNLSFNKLEGTVPIEGIFKNASIVSVMGNKKLCGGIPQFHLPLCNFQNSDKGGVSKKLEIAIAIILGLLGVNFVFYLISRMRLKTKTEKLCSSNSRNSSIKVSYRDLYNATNGFCTANILGAGSFGIVYKGVVEGGLQIAIKVINCEHYGASKSFIAECEALKNIRHRNIIKVLTVCSSVDYRGNDFKALVYQFMVNGSLEKWLHPHIQDDAFKGLKLGQRLNIVIDIAFALEYLHDQCETTLVHCDIKPNNVLLDDELIGHIGDFGLAKLIAKGIKYQPTNQSSSTGLRGTIGYAPPEYGLGSEVSVEGDAYSFGILLLEMFTGKRPIDAIFQDDWNLHKLAKKSLSNGVAEIIDPKLLDELARVDTIMTNPFRTNSKRTKECLISIVEIGVACSVELPGQRMTMSEVSARLCSTRNKFLSRPSGIENIYNMSCNEESYF